MQNEELKKRIRETRKQHHQVLNDIEFYRNAVNYIAVAQIYLKDNFLLRKKLKPEHLKDRLLGHWGTCPGINLIYSHCNRLINDHHLNMFLVTGPGHGAPANLANLFMEGSLQDYYPELTVDEEGLGVLIGKFSTPGGFPSHLYPGVPGTVHEGGELGYALATSYGAVMDNPDLIVTCIIGDGEAETGPTATAWHSHRFLDPSESGAVIPVLHLNGYKISSATIYGTMTDEQLIHLFTGYGYEVRMVEDDDIDADMFDAMDWAYGKIRSIQQSARNGEKLETPEWPLIIMKTPKGWTGIKEMNGKPIEGTFRAHQVPAKNGKKDPAELKLIEEWLLSYQPEEFFNSDGTLQKKLTSVCPEKNYRMGSNPHTFGGDIRKEMKLPDIHDFGMKIKRNQDGSFVGGEKTVSNMELLAEYLAGVIENNQDTFRIFSPDELESNRLTGVFKTTHRNFQWPVQDSDTYISNNGGRVIEMLSEHTCQGWLQGYLLTGRHGLFPSYEAFLGIITTMMEQFGKFTQFSNEISWRRPVSSLNYLETSTLWRQEHNGFSHQNPGFINSVLDQQSEFARVYLPPDANTLISTMDHCLKSSGYINLVIANKNPLPQWLSMEEAVEHCRAGLSVWRWASTDEGDNPDVILAGIGDVPTVEVMAAAQILRKEVKVIRVRVVNVTDLMVLEKEGAHPHGLDDEMFEAMFPPQVPVIINFHGYPSVIKQLLFGRSNIERFHVNGYREEGTTTTPFDMLVRNQASRYHLVIQAIRHASAINSSAALRAVEMISRYQYKLEVHREYIEKNAVDLPEVSDWKWSI